jgi:eukaryotic-like serine/threonine-protein kinase
MPDWNPRANDLFLDAAEIATREQRTVFLDEQCGGDAALRAQVEALLAASEKAGTFMDKPAAAPGLTVDYRPISEAAGTVIGPYKLLQQIGEGGFGVVYMAEQEKPVRRMVALKIIKAGMDTASVIARFESERQALALMDHPNIAKVFDAGATESGRPYFVMELVRGVPITDFCDSNHMTAEPRLRLFVDVCHAIQHAHHKGVIHRDIKPSNVLVTLHDGVPVVKVIDFGVAKATVQKLTEKTLFTAFGQMVGTPAYMSPEQAEMSGLDIDTRTDVFALGVLLYELLTGTTPLESKRLREAGYAEMQRLIREEEPPRPSNRLSSLGDSATVLAGNRGLDVKRLSRLLAGDLDWMVMKALEKDRTRRYETPGAFAEDVQRYLNREAIVARPPSAIYKFRKFAQRNRAAATTAAVVATVLLAGSAVSVWQAVRATRAEQRAADELGRAIKAEADAKAERDKVAAAEREAVAAQERASEAFKQSRVLMQAFGNLIDEVQRRLGDAPGMQALKLSLLQSSLQSLEKFASGGGDSREFSQSTAAAYLQMGRLFQQLGQGEQAFAQFQKCHEIVASLAAKNPSDEVALANLSATYVVLGEMSLELRRDLPASLDFYQKALRLRKELSERAPSGRLDPVKVKQDLAETYTRIGVTYLRLGEPARAAEYFRDAAAIRAELAARDEKNLTFQLDVARSHNALGEVQFRVHDWRAAKVQFGKALAANERVQLAEPANPRNGWELANTLGNFGLFALRTGDLAEAEKHLMRAQELMAELAVLDPKNAMYRRYLALANYRCGTLARRQGDKSAADRWNLECLRIREELASADAKSERRQMELLLIRARTGGHREMADGAAKILAKPDVDREVLVELAQCYSQATASVPDDPALRRRYLDQSLDLLRRARTLGYKDLVVLETDPDLDAVRGEPGFRALLTETKSGN